MVGLAASGTREKGLGTRGRGSKDCGIGSWVRDSVGFKDQAARIRIPDEGSTDLEVSQNSGGTPKWDPKE